MNIAKASILTFVSTVIKMCSGLVINKAISVFIGPSGLAIIGQFQNASAIIQTIASGGISNGVVKYTAEKSNLATLWSTSLIITLASSSLVSCLLLLFSKYFTNVFFGDDAYQFVFVLFGLTLILFSLNQFLLNIIVGLGNIALYTVVNILQSVFSVIFTSFLIFFFGLNGALIAMVTNQSVMFIVVLYKIVKQDEIVLERFRAGFNKEKAKKLSRYTLMTFVSVISLPVALIFVRNYIGQELSWEHAGYWQAMNYISAMYLLVVTTFLSTYYLPRMSRHNEKKLIINEIRSMYFFLLPIVVVAALVIYFSKELIVSILFSQEFYEIITLFKWYLIGDIVKVASCIISYILLAKAMTKVFILLEMSFATVFVVLSMSMLDRYGFVGLSYAYFISNAIYFIAVCSVVVKYLGYEKREKY